MVPLVPVFALLAIGAGALVASKKPAASPGIPVAATVTLTPGAAAPAAVDVVGTNQTIGVAVPPKGQLVSLSPVPPMAATASIVGGKGYVSPTAAGDVNVLWRAPDGSPQASVVRVTMT
jgi:hypothetical protein